MKTYTIIITVKPGFFASEFVGTYRRRVKANSEQEAVKLACQKFQVRGEYGAYAPPCTGESERYVYHHPRGLQRSWLERRYEDGSWSEVQVK